MLAGTFWVDDTSIWSAGVAPRFYQTLVIQNAASNTVIEVNQTKQINGLTLSGGLKFVVQSGSNLIVDNSCGNSLRVAFMATALDQVFAFANSTMAVNAVTFRSLAHLAILA